MVVLAQTLWVGKGKLYLDNESSAVKMNLWGQRWWKKSLSPWWKKSKIINLPPGGWLVPTQNSIILGIQTGLHWWQISHSAVALITPPSVMQRPYCWAWAVLSLPLHSWASMDWIVFLKIHVEDLPGGPVVKNPLANVGETWGQSLILELGRSPGRGHGNPL